MLLKIFFYLDADPARKVFIAVEKTSRPVEGVSSVVNGWTLLRGLVGSTKEDPLLGRGHLRTVIQKVFIFFHEVIITKTFYNVYKKTSSDSITKPVTPEPLTKKFRDCWSGF